MAVVFHFFMYSVKCLFLPLTVWKFVEIIMKLEFVLANKK